MGIKKDNFKKKIQIATSQDVNTKISENFRNIMPSNILSADLKINSILSFSAV